MSRLFPLTVAGQAEGWLGERALPAIKGALDLRYPQQVRDQIAAAVLLGVLTGVPRARQAQPWSLELLVLPPG